MAAAERREVYRFDGFCLDLGRGTLRGPVDVDLALRPKAFALAAYMVRNPGRLLPREELLDALWPDVTVTDDSLTQCVGDLRKALGDRAARVLRTVPRRGYVLVAEVRREDISPPPAAEPSPPTAAAADPTVDPAIARRDTVAIALFAGDTPADLPFARTLAADLTAELIRFEDLRVAADPGPGGFRVRGETHTAGNVRRATIVLDDTATGAGLWSERVDRPVDDPSPLPVAVVGPLAAAIALQIDRQSLRRARRGPTTARELCLLGRDLHQRGTGRDTEAARAMFVRAIAIDPDYAAAHAWQAFTAMRRVTHGWAAGGDSPDDWRSDRDEALRVARRAVDIEPDSPLCLSALAFALALDERWDDAVATAQVALATGRPADYGTRTSCGEVLAAAGHPEEATAAVSRALALDPHCPPRTRAVLGRALLLAGDPEAALAELRACAARLPDYAPCFRTTVVAASEAGRADEARAALREVRRLQPNWLPGDRPILWFLRRPDDVRRFRQAFAAAAQT